MRSPYPVQRDVFFREDALSFYLLGVYFADGCITRHSFLRKTQTYRYKVKLTSKDRSWLLAIRDLVAPGKPLYYNDKAKRWSELIFLDREVEDWLRSFGCGPRKTQGARIARSLPSRYRPDLVRGIIDGDGSVYFSAEKRMATVYICSAARTFLEDVISILPSGLSAKIISPNVPPSTIDGRKVAATLPHYRISMGGSRAARLLRWAYYDGNPLALPRKQELADSIVSHFNPKNPL